MFDLNRYAIGVCMAERSEAVSTKQIDLGSRPARGGVFALASFLCAEIFASYGYGSVPYIPHCLVV